MPDASPDDRQRISIALGETAFVAHISGPGFGTDAHVTGLEKLVGMLRSAMAEQ